MARSALLIAPLLALVLVRAAGGGAGADRTVLSPGEVSMLAASRQMVAFASAPGAGDCDRVRIWSLALRTVTPLGTRKPCGDAVSTGRGIAGLALAGSRAIWLQYTGGNIREWSLYTATRSSPKPRLLRFVARDVDGPAPVVLGDGDPALLPYAVDDAITVLRTDGSRAFTWRAPAPVTALAAGSGRVAAVLATGPVVLLSGTGSRLAEYAYAPGVVKALRLGGVGTLVQLVAGTIEVRSGATRRLVPLPPTATMLDFAEGVVLYGLSGRVRALRLSTAADVLLRTTGSPVRAALDPSGLAYVSGRQVRFVAWSRVAALLRGG